MSNEAVFQACIKDLKNAGIDAFIIRQIETGYTFYRDKYHKLLDENVMLRADNMELRGLVKHATTVPVR